MMGKQTYPAWSSLGGRLGLGGAVRCRSRAVARVLHKYLQQAPRLLKGGGGGVGARG